MMDHGFLRFLLDCVVRPRQAARTAHGIEKVWTVVILASVLSALAIGVSIWIRLRTETDPGLFAYTGPGNALLEASLESMISFFVSIVIFPLTLFIWNRVLGYHAQSKSVLAATVAGFGLVFVTVPSFELLTVMLWAVGSIAAEWFPLVAQGVISVGLSSAYFAESLAITYANSLVKNVFAAFLVLLMVGVPAAAIVGVPILATSDQGVSAGDAQ